MAKCSFLEITVLGPAETGVFPSVRSSPTNRTKDKLCRPSPLHSPLLGKHAASWPPSTLGVRSEARGLIS